MKTVSLKKRLLLGAGICSVVLILITGFAVQRYMQDYLRTELVSQLTLSLDELLSRLDFDTQQNRLSPVKALSDPRFSQPYSGYYWQIQTQEQVVRRSRSLWDTELKFDGLNSEFGLDLLHVHGPAAGDLLVVQQKVTLPDSEQFYWVSVAQESESLDQTLEGVNGSLAIGLGLLAVGVMALIAIQLGWGLRPLGQLRRELSEIEAGDKTGFDYEYPQEIDPLVKDINKLLQHHQALLERARTNAGNMAHALKTPLSIMQNELAADDSQRSALLSAQLHKMRQQIEYHLSASQVAAKQLLGAKCSPLIQCQNAVSAFSRLYGGRNITAKISVDGSVSVAVDARDFDEMAGNLIENAYKWAATTVEISATLAGDSLCIVIEDDGPGMTASECDNVIKRGWRLDEQAPGNGLGLSIVADMVDMYQGTLSLGRSPLGGLSASLLLLLRSRL